MNTAINTFNFQQNTVQVINKNGEAWFIAAEIAAMLGYRDSHNLTRILDSDEADTHIMSIRSENGVLQNREVSIINESGFYHAAFKSRKESVKQFRKWVTAEVLPQIRKTGGYQMPHTTPDDRTGLRQAVSAVVGKHHIDYSTAYSLVHQRFNVESIDELTHEQLGEAVKYCHALILDKSLNGEVLEKPQLPTQSAANFTNIQLQNMACLTYYSAWAMAILRKYSKPLRELGIKEAVTMWTLADESQSRIRSSREALESIVPQLEPYTADYICACFKDLDRMKREFGY